MNQKRCNLKVAYKEMVQDKQRELDEDEWCENLIDDKPFLLLLEGS